MEPSGTELIFPPSESTNGVCTQCTSKLSYTISAETLKRYYQLQSLATIGITDKSWLASNLRFKKYDYGAFSALLITFLCSSKVSVL
jgi:hypothetical protein